MTAFFERLALALESVALGVWAGAMFGFAFVFAPAAFRAVHDLGTFGGLVANAIDGVASVGTVCGGVAVVAALVRAALARDARPLARAALVLVALLASGYESRAIVPEMARVAATIPGALDSVPKSDARRAAYDALHARSTQVYGLAFLCVAGALATVGLGRLPQGLERGLREGPRR